MRKLIILLVFIVLLAGGGYLYVNKAKQAAKNKGQVNDSGVSQQHQLEDKKGQTSKVGTLQAQDVSWMLVDDNGNYEVIETYSVDFASYEGQLVEVTGKYSGDTLFVSEIVALQ